MDTVQIVILAVVGYLLGSINSAIIVSKVFMGYDIRTKGSGNAGLTNSLRCMGAKPTLGVLAGDILKTVIACVIGRMMIGPFGALIAGSFAIIGHMFPLYFRFKGGKGILSGVTMIFVFDWRIAAILCVVFFILVAATRWVSLGSIVGAALFPILTWCFWHEINMTVIAFVMAAAVIYMHRSNIGRLLNGTENKFSLHSSKK